MKKLSVGQIERIVSDLFHEHGYGIQFNMFDLGKILNEARKALANGSDGVQEMKDSIEKYRVRPK